MSSLVFYSQPNEVILATDSLAVSDNKGTPRKFCTKFYILPHLHGIICGTGLAQLVCAWFGIVNCEMAISDLKHLDLYAPKAIGKLWRSGYKDFSACTTTIYHFGFPADGSPLVSYAYRSTSGFVSEPLPHGMHLKPAGDVPDSFEFPRDFRSIMDSQRAKQANEPPEKRLYIGGEILVCHLTRSGYTVWTADRFPDYDRDMQAIDRP